MKILIPTAKEMNLRLEQQPFVALSTQSKTIVSELSKLSVEELAKFYKIRPEMAQKEFENIKQLETETAPAYSAFQLFDGLMYRQINRTSLSPEQISYLNKHVIITSSLYGAISADSVISPHRLDFMVNVKPKGHSLKKYWQSQFDKSVENDEILISLLSSEFEQVFSKSTRDRMIRVEFFENKDNLLKKHSTISKKGRGAFLNSCLEQNITKLSDMKQLQFEGFAMNMQKSNDKQWVFIR